MSTTTTTSFQKYGEWIFRVLLFIGIFLNLWLTTNFVTRSEFESSNKQIREELVTATKSTQTEFNVFTRENASAHLAIQVTIADIAVAVKLLAANQIRLDDHESRLRTVERNQIEVMSRVSGLEKHIHPSTMSVGPSIGPTQK
jgi:hypothetical protein